LLICHSRESGNPVCFLYPLVPLSPQERGMVKKRDFIPLRRPVFRCPS
jgi:hypothetical protein